MEEIQLMKRLFAVVAVVAVVAFCVTGMLAEEAHHPHAAVLKHGAGLRSAGNAPTTPPAGIWVPWADFATFSNATNSDGSYLWPCFGDYAPSSGTFTGDPANPDCPSIGDPSVPFGGGVVLGDPDYLWSVADCNATATSSPDCGDQEAFVTDNSGDLTDDLWVSIVITQTAGTIYDSGTVDYGQNVFGLTAADFPIIWVNYNPQNFGTMGQTGENNGNCSANANYPLTSNNPADITYPYVISANKTCVAAASGTATGTFTVEYGTPKYTEKTKTSCTDFGVPSPCYDVTYTKVWETTGKFTIDLY
jgi:hypothetical protein